MNNPVGHNKKGRGLVVSIRINPKDCQTILALLDKSGVQRSNQTFSSLVSLCVSGMLEAARIDGTVREPDPFRYWDEVGQYHKGVRVHAKENITATLSGRSEVFEHAERVSGPNCSPVTGSGNITEPARRTQSSGGDDIESRPVAGDVRSIEKAGRRLQELINMEAEETEEYKALYKIVYPHG